MDLHPQPLSEETFAPYGKILRRDPQGEAFQALHREEASRGWRVALLEVTPGPIPRVHRHPDTDECFAPLFGETYIAVAPPESPHDFRLFNLDEPVLVYRRVWHEVLARSPGRIFIAENANLSGEDHFFPKPITW